MKGLPLLKTILACAFVVLTTSLFAQGGFDAPCDGSPFQPASCPIDGGVSLLVAAGALLGGKKAYDVAKK